MNPRGRIGGLVIGTHSRTPAPIVAWTWAGVGLWLIASAGCQGARTEVPPRDRSQNKPAATAKAQPITLVDRTPDSGITFRHSSGQEGRYLLPETMTGGLALLDYDQDGWLDIYFCSGRPLLRDGEYLIAQIGQAQGGQAQGQTVARGGALYRNLGNWQFVDVTESAGLVHGHFGLGVTVGDFDNDGFPDLFLSNYAGDALYHNDGTGRFREVTMELGELPGGKFSAGACFVDVDADGALDLFVGRYVQLPPSQLPTQAELQRVHYPGPQDFPADTSMLLMNMRGKPSARTDQTSETELSTRAWLDVSLSSGIGRLAGTAMGCITGDFDGDGDVDIYVANDEMPNYLFRNDGNGRFEEAALLMGAAVNSMGAASGSMGVDAGDLDGDGRVDLIVTTFENEPVELFRLITADAFQEVTRQTRLAEETAPQVTWGCCLADLDCDGDRDVYLATGHLDRRHQNSYYDVPDMLYVNLKQETGQWYFENVTQATPALLSQRSATRGAALGDLDNDGDLDIVALNIDALPTILENRTPRGDRHWLALELVGRQANRDAVGTKVKVTAGKFVWVDEVRNGRGYQSYWGRCLHFGLGSHVTIDSLELIWPDGQQQRLTGVVADQKLLIVQPAKF